MRLTTFICLLAVITGCAGNGYRREAGVSVRPGDLLFRDSNCGPLCDAIKKVTTGYKGTGLTHVGIAASAFGETSPLGGKDANGCMIVIEAVSKGVVATDLRTFLNQGVDSNGQSKVMVGRLKRPYRRLIPAAINEAEALMGKPYDKGFEIDNDAYYCSELIYEIFKKANSRKGRLTAGGEPVFKLEPMTFKDTETGLTLPAWQEYFSKLGVEIPEGRPGINPGGISRSTVIDIVYMSKALSKTR